MATISKVCQAREMTHGVALWLGPVATLFASTVAAGVASTFGYFQYRLGIEQKAIANLQKEIASSQRDIAREKLKSDLYDRRVRVYRALRDACLYGMQESHKVEWSKMMMMVSEIQDCVFLFDHAFAMKVMSDREKLIEFATNAETLAVLNRNQEPIDDVRANHRQLQREISDIYRLAPNAFSTEMGIRVTSTN